MSHRHHHRRSKKNRRRHGKHASSDDEKGDYDPALTATDLMLIREVFKEADSRGRRRLRHAELEKAVRKLAIHGNPIKYDSLGSSGSSGSNASPELDHTAVGAKEDAGKQVSPVLVDGNAEEQRFQDHCGVDGGQDINSQSNSALKDHQEKVRQELEAEVAAVMKHQRIRALLCAPHVELKRVSPKRQLRVEPESASGVAKAFDAGPVEDLVSGIVGEMTEGDFLYLIGHEVWPQKETVTSYLVRKYMHRNLEDGSKTSGIIHDDDMHYVDALAHTTTIELSVRGWDDVKRHVGLERDLIVAMRTRERKCMEEVAAHVASIAALKQEKEDLGDKKKMAARKAAKEAESRQKAEEDLTSKEFLSSPEKKTALAGPAGLAAELLQLQEAQEAKQDMGVGQFLQDQKTRGKIGERIKAKERVLDMERVRLAEVIAEQHVARLLVARPWCLGLGFDRDSKKRVRAVSIRESGVEGQLPPLCYEPFLYADDSKAAAAVAAYEALKNGAGVEDAVAAGGEHAPAALAAATAAMGGEGSDTRSEHHHLAFKHFTGEPLCPRLTALDLSHNHLCGPLPASLGLCVSLLSLDLSHNALSGACLPSSIGGLAPFHDTITGRRLPPPPPPPVPSDFTRDLPLDAYGRPTPAAGAIAELAYEVAVEKYENDRRREAVRYPGCRQLRVINLEHNMLGGGLHEIRALCGPGMGHGGDGPSDHAGTAAGEVAQVARREENGKKENKMIRREGQEGVGAGTEGGKQTRRASGFGRRRRSSATDRQNRAAMKAAVGLDPFGKNTITSQALLVSASQPSVGAGADEGRLAQAEDAQGDEEEDCCLPSLVELNLSHNRISGHLPLLLSTLPELRVLNLQSNLLVGVVPPEWGEHLAHLLPPARHPTERGRAVKRVAPLSQIGTAEMVYHMHVQAQVHLHHEKLRHFPRLEVINLRDNKITGRLHSNLVNLTNLKQLWINENRLDNPDECRRRLMQKFGKQCVQIYT